MYWLHLSFMISYVDLKFLNYSLYYDDPCCMLHILHSVDKVLNLLRT